MKNKLYAIMVNLKDGKGFRLYCDSGGIHISCNMNTLEPYLKELKATNPPENGVFRIGEFAEKGGKP